MSIEKRVKKVGGSLAIFIPRDFARDLNIQEGSKVAVSLEGKRIVVSSEDRYATTSEFRSAFREVMDSHGATFAALAEYDSGKRRKL